MAQFATPPYRPEQVYLNAMSDCLKRGHSRMTRNGETLSLFGHQMRFDLANDGFPLLTTKALPFWMILAELLWFLEAGTKPNAEREEIYGRLSTHRLSEIAGKDSEGKDRDIKIWNGDAGNFTARGKTQFDGDVGLIYGSQWRLFSKYVALDTNENSQNKYVRIYVDQIANLITSLKADPYGRYHRVTAWNPADLDDMALPACHCGFQCYVSPDEYDSKIMRLSLHMEMRSTDMFLGLPFNIASYALLAHMLLKCVDIKWVNL
jgi:thymidylate synthase